jgi:hypothetical protein
MDLKKFATKFANWHSALEILFLVAIVLLLVLGVVFGR